MNEADVVFLCLPDAAAQQAPTLVENPDTILIDASTAHRTAPGWVYAFPELSQERRQSIRQAKRIASPGCHASGFIALAAPLVRAGLLAKEALLCCQSVTGYSGGGKGMIAQYEADGAQEALKAPRLYGIGQQHKHLPEMQAVTGLVHAPVFCPTVAPFYSGMLVTVGLFSAQLCAGARRQDVLDAYRALYRGPVVSYAEAVDEGGFVDAAALSGTDRMEVAVLGNEERMVLAARFDNLGKGAAGAAIQAMNLALGRPETAGLVL